jgi:hypothetical protein
LQLETQVFISVKAGGSKRSRSLRDPGKNEGKALRVLQKEKQRIAAVFKWKN